MCEIKDCALLILAGGKSRRMGQSKAQLPIGGKTFLTHMIEKGRSTGFSEILVSGNPDISGKPEDIRIIPDILEDRGPLGGLYSCFSGVSRPACFVISVDVPLISPKTIRTLIMSHDLSRQEATLLSHGKTTEPLIGVYNTGGTEILYDVIKDHSAAIFAYLDRIGYRTVPLEEPPETISNINTPLEYAHLNQMNFSDNYGAIVEKAP